MPKKCDSRQKGDLYLQFNIVFPSKFNAKCKEGIVEILRKAAPEAPMEE